MKIFITTPAQKQLKKFPPDIKKKTHKQFQFLQTDVHHPSLRFKKMSGSEIFEGRIDNHYRFTGKFVEEDFYITFMGTHDEGLGKK